MKALRILMILTMVAVFSMVFVGAGMADMSWGNGSMRGPEYEHSSGPTIPAPGYQNGPHGPTPEPHPGPQGPAPGQPGPGDAHQAFMNTMLQMPYQPINDVELAGMMRIREEEKLAHDVYQFLANHWNNPTFANMAQAEQTHMETMLALMGKYGIPDPVPGNIPGKFSDPEFQNLYHELTTRGMASFENALEVGARVEDMNIHDLNAMTAMTDNADIRFVYQNHMASSVGQMRMLTGFMGSYGHTYSPQYMSQEAYDQMMMGM